MESAGDAGEEFGGVGGAFEGTSKLNKIFYKQKKHTSHNWCVFCGASRANVSEGHS